MIEVEIDSIRISLVTQHRIVMLKEIDGERQIPIWIGPCEADAITIELQDVKVARPVTHDLLKNVISEMGGHISHVLVKELRDGIFHARLYLDANGTEMNIDCRPSDAIALAVRVNVPIFIAEEVMDEVGILPEADIQEQESAESADSEAPETPDAFADFLNTLDFEDFDEE
ncbi:MAG: bifunctional nuclease family protein [Ardenticatenaceae bacterium]|nr:bifunctional nuclease family protein [Anaerolineales bacterium]MCB8922841.1 bifunctional nuclease family protein [Ardenticatenaceae bacterium]MCB9005420.1 bifunctional nuclease family protein [Ardenticatenaceae bacterium]